MQDQALFVKNALQTAALCALTQQETSGGYPRSVNSDNSVRNEVCALRVSAFTLEVQTKKSC